MNHANKNLYQIGEVTKMLGVTRRMLLNYEDLGLLTPAYKNESSGFRYYSADNIVHIRIIKVLQGLGLSLSEINKYFNNTEKLEDVIERMTALRSQLDLCIAQLQLRQSQTSEPEIHFTTLPSFTAFCQEFKDSDLTRKLKICARPYRGNKNINWTPQAKCVQRFLSSQHQPEDMSYLSQQVLTPMTNT